MEASSAGINSQDAPSKSIGQTPLAETHTPLVSSLFAGFGKRLALIFIVLLLLVSVVLWQVIRHGQNQVIEYQAREVAEVVAQLAVSVRATYNRQVAEKLHADGFGSSVDYLNLNGFVPLPEQFMKLLGQQASDASGGLYRYRALSKWSIDANQGLIDDFQRWAWERLEAQDQPIPQGPIAWVPVLRIETNNGMRTLRYMRADPATAQSCVDCHNAQESTTTMVERRLRAGYTTTKQWRLHQLLGAIEVNIPLEKVEAMAQDQVNYTLIIVSGAIAVGMLIIGFFLFINVSQARSMERKLTWQATHDSLTRLPNRNLFEQRLAQVLERSKLDNSLHALMCIDIDQFKIINETCGHGAGDTLLHQLGDMIKAQLRTADTLARIGGDEFGIVLENCSLDAARKIADTLRQATRNFRFIWGRRTLEVGFSIGLVSVTRDSESVSTLLSAADVACHTAKSAGRHRIHVLHPDDAEMNRHRSEVEWVAGINRALEEGRMRLVVQDAVQLPERVHGKRYQEILLRMIDEKGNPLPTATVITAAERFNYMPVIDRWVVCTVFGLIYQGKLRADADNVVAINLSGNSINDDEFHDYILTQLQNYKIPVQHICFEITETAAIHSIDKAAVFINSLKSIGCQFALDDFGAGSSSFGYLKRLSVDYLKIDGIFVRDIEKDSFNRAMVEAVAQIGRVTGIAIIAEWVENDTVLDIIRSIGIDYAQGYALSRPRALDAINMPPQKSAEKFTPLSSRETTAWMQEVGQRREQLPRERG